jgi:hypothetical protein
VDYLVNLTKTRKVNNSLNIIKCTSKFLGLSLDGLCNMVNATQTENAVTVITCRQNCKDQFLQLSCPAELLDEALYTASHITFKNNYA